ncbi:MAG: Stk1 family PASTA domain-containing Ser/Thr kinase [bacterium]|nr:Stk1 family PASTA domain-containing Ser/Thr kinase [bacterium]
MLKVGMYLQERYEILEKIGSGGMADVYKARCHKLNRLVAVKVLKEEFSEDVNFVNKFRMEAQAAAGLSHPNIVNVYDVIDENDLHAIVMELIEGVTLKSYIQKKGHLEVRESIGIAIQVCQGIAAAHEQHIIHRDIKPQNMIISKDGKVKVADFGIARAVTSQTIGANVMGSVHYISPEQARGGYSDERSDIYSLGITMYEMVTGHVPFEGDNTVAIALAHLETPITPPTVYVKEIPSGLEQIILKCTEKKKSQRYANIEGLISDLRKVLMNPDEEPAQRTAAEAATDKTITIGYQERKILNEREQEREKQEESEREVIRLDEISGKHDIDVMLSRPKEERREVEQEERRTRRSVERMMVVFGSFCAIVIAGVLLFVVWRLGNGMFTPLTSGTETEMTLEADSSDSEENPTSSEEVLNETQVRMPKVTGLSVDEAEQQLAAEQLTMKVEYAESDEVEKGYVISQQYPEGTAVDRYSAVLLTVSEGSDKIDLSGLALIGKTAEEAQEVLTQNSLRSEIVEEENAVVTQGSVIRYLPEGKVEEGSTITLYVSAEEKSTPILVPNLLGMTEENAAAALEAVKLVKGTVTKEYSETIAQGLVITQNINPNSEVEEGQEVNLTISQGPSPRHYKYVASIDDTCNLKSVFGPSSSSSSMQVEIRLKQRVNGEDVYTVLMEPRVITGDTILPIKYKEIEGAENVNTGELEVVDVVNGTILRTYNLNFFKVEVYGE